MTFAEYTTQFQTDILPLKKPATVATFSSHIRKVNARFGDILIQDISNQDVQRFFTQQTEGLTPKSVKNLWATMKVILEQARRDGYIEKLPEPVLPKVHRTQQEWLRPEQMKQIIQAAPGYVEKVFYWLLAETGVRIGEALGLRWQDVDLAKRTITVNQSVFARVAQVPKTDSSVRVIAISRQLRDLLTGLSMKDYLFSSDDRPWAMSTALLHLQDLMRSVGMEPMGFHAFRRGNATIMSNLGIPEKIAAGRQGHALPGMTFGLYAQFEAGMDKQFVDQIAGILCITCPDHPNYKAIYPPKKLKATGQRCSFCEQIYRSKK